MNESLLENYDDNRFMVDYRNSLILYGALALFSQSRFKEYYRYIISMKYELKGYDFDDRNKFENFTLEFYNQYYKGDKSFKAILKECHN